MKVRSVLAKALAVTMMLSLLPQTAMPISASSVVEESAVVGEVEKQKEAELPPTEPAVSLEETKISEPETSKEDKTEVKSEGDSKSVETEISPVKENETPVSEENKEAEVVKEVTEKYPAYSYQYEDINRGISIQISAPQGAFPEGVAVNIQSVSSDKVIGAIKEASKVKNMKASDIVAYDFDFYQSEKHNIEPKREISVTFKNLSIQKEESVSAYHLKNESSAAEKVEIAGLDKAGDIVELKANDFSIYAIVSTPAASGDGKIWIDNDEATTYPTINEAVAAATEGATIHIQGKFGENGNAATGASISKNITLDIAGDTEMTGKSNVDGITLTSGSKMHASNGATLTMTGFQTALTVAKGAEVNDGNYIFKNNKSTRSGINIQGSVKGSSGRDKLVIKADDTSETNFYSGSATFENATVEVISQKWTWQDASALNLNNVSMTLSGFGQGYYIQGGAIVDSFLRMKDPGLRWGLIPWGNTAMAFQGSGSVISGSTIQVDYGSNAGISIELSSAATAMTIENSTLDFRNGGTGGFNVNTGDITVSNSVIKGDGKNDGALYGAQDKGKITFKDSSRVETPAMKNQDNGLGQAANNYVVLGGSFLVKYTDAYYDGASIPTNGDENGNEKLDWVTLADTSQNEVTVENKLGNTYLYSVKEASSDGKKHIFVPTVKVTFDVNSATGVFADGSGDQKVVKTVRGNSLGLIESTQMPQNPTNTNQELVFAGWYYTDKSGVEQPFVGTMPISSDLTVKAKWNAQNTLRYTGNLDGDILIGEDTEHTAVKEVRAGDKLDFTGRLNVTPIQNKIKLLSNQFVGNINSIVTENIKSGFTAVLVFPNGLTVPDDLNISLTDNDLFEISNTVKDSNKVTVTMTLKKDYKKFIDLLKDVTTTKSILDVTIPNITVADTVADTALLTTKGTVSGTFSGKAITESGQAQLYDMKWTAVQTADGKDAVQEEADNTSIQYTVKASNPTVLSMEETLYGDILIGEDTEHTALHEVKVGDNLTYTGRLYVAPIKEKINALKARYQGDADKISTADIESTFITNLTIPEGLSLPENISATLTDNDLFKVASVDKDGKDIKITMALKKKYDKFGDLYKDVISVDDILNVDVADIKVDDSNADGSQLTVKGKVEGTFLGKAMAPSGKSEIYNFKWTATQLAEGKDFIQEASDNTGIQYTIKVNKPTTITTNETLYGDILIGDDTEHTALHEVKIGDNLTYTGRLYIAPIKEKINLLKARYQGDLAMIDLTDIESSFTTTFTVPVGLTISDSPVATLTENDLFKIDSVTKEEKSLKIGMSLKKTYDKFSDLYTDVTSVPDVLNVDVSDITVGGANSDGTKLTVKGSVDGNFKGKASVPSGKQEIYDFKWTAVQLAEGKDFIQDASDDTSIQYTVKVNKPMLISSEENLYGDILIGSDTEHEAVHMVDAGEKVTYTGRLYVAPIKEKIKALKAQYKGQSDKIAVENIESNFITKLVIPDKINIPDTLTASLTENPLFEVSEVKKDGNAIQITMVLKKQYTKFDELFDDVTSVEDVLDVNVANLQIESTLSGGERLTVQGVVNGVFTGKAISPFGKSQAYDFKWKAIQTADGRDYIQGADDEDTIQYTVEVREQTLPPVEMTNIIVHKTWKGKVGDKAVIEIYNGEEMVKTTTLTEAGEWKQVFELPKYDVMGNEITYAVKEVEISGYETEIKKSNDGTYEVINTWKDTKTDDKPKQDKDKPKKDKPNKDKGIKKPNSVKPGQTGKHVKSRNNPVTGDNSHRGFWILALLAASLLLVGDFVFLKKIRRKK